MMSKDGMESLSMAEGGGGGRMETSRDENLPPPAPPLPPNRLGTLQRIIGPWGLNRGQRPPTRPTSHVGSSGLRSLKNVRDFRPPPSQTAAHRTGIPITALDINQQKTHAILAGKEILKTVRVQDGKVTEDFNLRSSINAYASTHGSSQADASNRRREYLPARDVRWSNGRFDHIIATAGSSGRIALYDVNAAGSRIELAWLHEHTSQVNKLDFDPFAGYLLLSASQDKSVRLWDIREPRTTKSRQRFEVRNGVRDVRWSPAESLEFAVCADGGVIQKWDARYPLGPKLSINGHDRACYAIDWHPDGRHVISGGYDKFIRVWDFQSDNRRQKPAFQLKAPQAIKNIRWRPACWSSEISESGQWQSSQIATSYHLDDPRIHVWDLRRPLVPFRELDRYNSPANDLLWASKDLIWTVGDEGMFTQTDVTFAPQLHNELPPCALQWTPDGEMLMFSENRTNRHGSAEQDPSLGFLNVSEEKLSGENNIISRSLTDDEINLDGIPSNNSQSRRGKATLAISNKSQTSTPPSADQPPSVLPLDKAVLNRPDLFNNDQTGMTGSIPGTATDSNVIEFLAANYARPCTIDERKKSPTKILQRLEQIFQQNADVCDTVAMYRTAQSWRILGAVIIPELQEWADQNRSRRKLTTSETKMHSKDSTSTKPKLDISSWTKVSGRSVGNKNELRRHNVTSNLSKGMKEAEKGKTTASDLDSHSDMTTPMAKPLPESPAVGRKQLNMVESEDNIDNLPPLPPSVLISHSTASTAARALLDNSSMKSETPPSSPEKHRRIDQATLDVGGMSVDGSTQSTGHVSQNHRSKPQPIQNQRLDSSAKRAAFIQSQRQEDRRAALRDYKAQARPIFTLDEPRNISSTDMGERHDSADSFPMFSASTESSQRDFSLVHSFESPDQPIASSSFSNWPDKGKFLRSEPSNSRSDELDLHSNSDRKNAEHELQSSTSDSLPSLGLDGATDSSFGLNESSRSDMRSTNIPQDPTWETLNESSTVPRLLDSSTDQSTSPELFHFETGLPSRQPTIHTVNPIHGVKFKPINPSVGPVPVKDQMVEENSEDLHSENYIYQDFRPIDPTTYEPKSPFAWSSLPLICHSIAFDLDTGIGHGQFSAHLLMHVIPYFFHSTIRKAPNQTVRTPDNLAERLMRPDLSQRVISSIFRSHCTIMKQMTLYDYMAEMKKICIELGCPEICSSPIMVDEELSAPNLMAPDVHLLSIVCSQCQNPIATGQETCNQCRRSRSPCPICLSIHRASEVIDVDKKRDVDSPICGKLFWAVCQACGHGGHVDCLAEWFSQHDSNGECPSLGCGCDCGPGTVMQQRIARQIRDEDESRLVRGAGSSTATPPDPVKVRASPAVDKTRAVLRGWNDQRVSVSGDERGLSSRRASSRGKASGLSNQRKSVRVLTPGEETRKSDRHPTKRGDAVADDNTEL